MSQAPDYKFKFDTLVEHCKRQDAVIAELRYDLNIARLYQDGAVWFWAGDGTDNLETLACPVVIQAGDLRAMLSAEKPDTIAVSREDAEVIASFFETGGSIRLVDAGNRVAHKLRALLAGGGTV